MIDTRGPAILIGFGLLCLLFYRLGNGRWRYTPEPKGGVYYRARALFAAVLGLIAGIGLLVVAALR